MAAQFPCVTFHLHGDQLWPLDIFLDLEEIDVVELNYDVGATSLDEKIIPAWARMRTRKPCIAFAHVTLEEAARIRAALPPDGFAFQTLSATIVEGQVFYQLMGSSRQGAPA